MRVMMRGKIHGARVTGTKLHYSGSLAVDSGLLKAAGMLPHEMVHVWNVSNGKRFRTYVVPGKRGEVTVMGAAARLCRRGDEIIIAAEEVLAENEAWRLKPKIVFVDEKNRLKGRE
ncbi:MAG: aspartate 1-decarboxylase [Candidatus Micrarchaeia archaeon]